MQNIRHMIGNSKSANERFVRAYMTGWEDARLGRGWNSAYDTWDQVQQCNYEQGRLAVTNVIAAGIKPLRYVRMGKRLYNGDIMQQPNISAQNQQAARLVGVASPKRQAA